MSAYNEKYNLFLQPETNQYGNHMVMSNVQKQNKHKYVNIDTKFSDEYEHTQTSSALACPPALCSVGCVLMTSMQSF